MSKTLYLIHHAHNDIGYTETQACGSCEFRCLVTLDAGLDWCRAANAAFLVTRG